MSIPVAATTSTAIRPHFGESNGADPYRGERFAFDSISLRVEHREQLLDLTGRRRLRGRVRQDKRLKLPRHRSLRPS